MAFPAESEQKDKPGRFHKNWDENNWQCDICQRTFHEYQQIIGHMGAHPKNGPRRSLKGLKIGGRPSNARVKDPMGMTIIELIETIEALRQQVINIEESSKDAIIWQNRVKALLSDE